MTDQKGAPRITTAEAWKKKAQDVAVAQGLTMPLELPSGVVVEVTRPPLDVYFMFGIAPTALTDLAYNATKGKTPDPNQLKAEALYNLAQDPEKMLRNLLNMRDFVTAAVVRPRIVLDADPSNPNEISPSMVPGEDFAFLMSWVGEGCPGLPVETENGGVDLDAVKRFRAQWQRRTSVRQNLREVQPSAQPKVPRRNKRHRSSPGL